MNEEENIRDKKAQELEDDWQGYVMVAKFDGTFDAKREAFNKARSNQWTNEDGRLVSHAVDGMVSAKEGTQVHETALGKIEVDEKGKRTLHTRYATVAATGGWAGRAGEIQRCRFTRAGPRRCAWACEGSGGPTCGDACPGR